MRARDEIFNEANRKRALPEQTAAGYGDAKRQKTEAAAAPQPPLRIQPLAPGPHTLAEVFSLTNNPGLHGFDVTVVPAPLTARINVRTLASLDQGQLDLAINVSFQLSFFCFVFSKRSTDVDTIIGSP